MFRHKFLSLKFFVAKNLKVMNLFINFLGKSNKVLIEKTFESLIILAIET